MSDTPIAEKLQIKGTRTACVIGAPASLRDRIAPGVIERPQARADVLLAFAQDSARLSELLAAGTKTWRGDAIVWVAYPKRTSALDSDLHRERVRELAASQGWDTVSQIALDADWSAMRLKRLG
jgi:hypothetical protein